MAAARQHCHLHAKSLYHSASDQLRHWLRTLCPMVQQLLGISHACCFAPNNKQTPCAARLAATSQSSLGAIGSCTRCICLISFWCVQLSWRLMACETLQVYFEQV